jgi:hypothetical protein
MLEERGLEVYGSPRGDSGENTWMQAWLYARESLGYMLWRIGIRL